MRAQHEVEAGCKTQIPITKPFEDLGELSAGIEFSIQLYSQPLGYLA
jgi:hypothetical protein